MANNKIRIVGEYVITENPFDGRMVAIHYSDGTMAVIRK